MGVLEGMAERPDRTDILKAFKKPKVLIAGIDDQLIPLKTSKDMARMIEELMLVEIKGAGHMHMMEKPFETGSAVLGLIKSSKEIV
jgi:pimeloyl-ACP methyl ester carboxylesterase